MKYQKLMLFGYLGLIGSILVGIGEFLMHYNNVSYTSDIPYGFMLHVSKSNMTTGHFLMVAFVPFYFFGYWHLYHALKPGNKKLALAVLILGIYAFTIGGIWIGSRAHLGYLIHSQAISGSPELFESLVESYTFHLESLVQALRLFVFLISIFFVITILKGDTLYPKWMAFFNPILLLGIVFGLFFIFPTVGNYLVPTAMNVAHFVLFAASLFSLGQSSLSTNS